MPYIPEEHKKYGLLPHCVENGGEVFCYPTKLIDRIRDCYAEDISCIPYGYVSYDEYFSFIEEYKNKTTDDVLRSLFDELKQEIIRYNKKEEWSICRYIGKEMSLIKGLTPNQCYYWPCHSDNPKYEGVIDDEEFTSYWYPTDAELWEIISDPTGMAYDAIHNQNKRNTKTEFNNVMKSLNGENWDDI